MKFFATAALAAGVFAASIVPLGIAAYHTTQFIKGQVENVTNNFAPAGIPIGVEPEVAEGKFYASSEPVPSTYTAECEYHRGAKQCLVNVTGANEFEAGFTLYEGSSAAYDHTGTRYDVTVNEANNGTTVLHLGNGYMAFNNTNATNFQF